MGNSLKLIGSSFGKIANTASLSFTGPGTIMAMIKIEKTLTRLRMVFVKGSDINSSGGWGAFMALNANNTILAANVTGGTQHNTFGVTALVPGRWYHIAYTWSTSARKIYINGMLDVSAAGIGNIRHSGDSVIGVSANGREGYFNDGLLDEISLWNKELTQSEIQSNMYKALDASHASLKAYWNFDNDVMPTATDVTVNKNKAVFNAGAALSLDDALSVSRYFFQQGEEIRSFIDSSWSLIGHVPITQLMIDQGMVDLSLLSRKVTLLSPIKTINRQDILHVDTEGKLFSGTLNLIKHKDIRSIRF